MPKLSPKDSAGLIGHLQAVISTTKAAAIFDVHRSTVHRLKTKFEEESTVKGKKQGSGRTRKTSQEQDQAIVQTH